MKLAARIGGRLGRLPLGGKLISSFVLVLLLTATLGAVSFVALGRVNQASDELASKWLPGVGFLTSARAAILEVRELEVKHTRAPDPSYMGEYEEKIVAGLAVVAKNLDAAGKLLAEPEERKQLDAFTKTWGEYLAINKKVLALSRGGKQDDARDIGDGASKMAADDAVSALDRLTAFGFESGQAAADRAAKVYAAARLWVLALVAGSLCIGLALALVITRGLLRQLGGEPRVATELARAVASGNLSTRIDVAAGDSTSLMACLKEMQTNLSRVVATVRQGSEGVATASAEIAQGNNDLSARTEQQASALQQTAASMEQLGSTVNHNADNARQADQLARGASQVAIKGGEAVSQVVATMKGINDSSRKIADITGVIDGIAFQTNILALNAAVEAARAGEQGRGFAVVAAEVRSLAQRSAEAAKQIKSLIATSVERVEQGTAQVDRAGETMKEVVESIQRVTQIVNEISSASTEQSSGVQQVGEAVTQMDQTTQQNSALVEQSAAAAESLKHQAAQLVQAVAVFRLDTTSHAV